MRFNGEKQEFELSTGTRIYAHAAALSPSGYSAGERAYEISTYGAENFVDLLYGYDGRAESIATNGKRVALTAAERREIADYMIAEWLAWAAPRAEDTPAEAAPSRPEGT